MVDLTFTLLLVFPQRIEDRPWICQLRGSATKTRMSDCAMWLLACLQLPYYPGCGGTASDGILSNRLIREPPGTITLRSSTSHELQIMLSENERHSSLAQEPVYTSYRSLSPRFVGPPVKINSIIPASTAIRGFLIDFIFDDLTLMLARAKPMVRYSLS
jgi:hypothetical protein